MSHYPPLPRGDGEGLPRQATWRKLGTRMACLVETPELCSSGHGRRHTQRSSLTSPFLWCSKLPPVLLIDWDFLLFSLPPPSFLPYLKKIFLEQGNFFFLVLTNISRKEKNIFKIKCKKLDIWSSFFTSIVLVSEGINIELVIPGGSPSLSTIETKKDCIKHVSFNNSVHNIEMEKLSLQTLHVPRS